MASLYKKKVVEVDPKTGKRKTVESKKWWGCYTDANGTRKRVSLAASKNVAQQMLAEIVAKVERERAGLVDPTENEMKRPILQHVDDFEKHQKAKNNTPYYVREIVGKVKRCISYCKWRTLRHIKATDVEGFLTDLREKECLSLQTSNHYLRAIKTFVHWLIENHRLNVNPLLGLKTLNVRTDRRHDRRALTEEEFGRLINVAQTGPPAWGLVGPDRAMLYMLAAWTGFRKGELGSLTPRSFNLNGKPATVKIEAAYSKHRREDVQVLHPDLVTKLRKWLELKKPKDNEILFPISRKTCGTERDGAAFMVYDLAAARNFWLSEAETPEEKKGRIASDFLKYQDSNGKFADFHALRHTFITNLGRAGVSPKTAQTLARHSDISLTMQIYTHIDQAEQEEAINSLPPLPGMEKPKEDKKEK